MRIKLLIAAVLCFAGLNASAQTKGTNAVGLGYNISKNESTTAQWANKTSSKSINYGIGYGYFFRDNQKIAFDFAYSTSENIMENSENNFRSDQEFVGGIISYQKYYPVIKKFYAFWQGRVGYSHGNGSHISVNTDNLTKSDNYNLGASGGFAWFINKRFALEANMLSADVSYAKSKTKNDFTTNNQYLNSSTYTAFSLSSSGVFNNLGFKIFLLF